MQLGFVSAILADQSLEQVFEFAADVGFDCVELMCWPISQAERRYAGVTHVDCTDFGSRDVERLQRLIVRSGVGISGLGYYPNPLTPRSDEAAAAVTHIHKVIAAAGLLGIRRMNTFVGRDWTRSVNDNWPQFLTTWKPLIEHAEKLDVKVGIENCPMSFTQDEWPGGKNLATTPALWRRMFADIPSEHFGLNFDPSHFVWQMMDYLPAMREFQHKLFHVHAKDVRIDRDRLNQVGIMAHPAEFHTPKLPGLGDVNWGQFFSTLTDCGYRGAVCVEVEDRAYEGSLALRQASLVQSHAYLRNFIPSLVHRG
ncbi:MAG: sugar phosphate isomerase/epimerase [Planctomycetota bacterium]|nr:MAG: sugar phosphate isomerase/epimerase [Planctomycetota bacterium]